MITESQIETFLRTAKYDTKILSVSDLSVICFENDAILGFIYLFESSKVLLDRWNDLQTQTLCLHEESLRAAGEKAWNIYSVFITGEVSPKEISQTVEHIEEDFTYTRKIAKTNINTISDFADALLPIMPIKNKPSIERVSYEDKLRSRLVEVSPSVVTAFLKISEPSEIAKILLDSK